MSRACTGLTQTGEEQLFEPVSAPRESPRRQPRPNGQVPPACRGPHVPCRPRRRIRLPLRIQRRPALPPRDAGRATGGAFSCMGALAAHPRAHASLPGLLAHIRGPALADGLAAQGAARVRCQTRVAQCFGPPRPRLRRGRYGGPACPRLLARAASPRRHRRARAPRRPWDAGSKSGCKFLYALFCCGLAAGDVGLDAQHDAHGEDADDCGDAGDRRVQRGLPTLSAPPTRPTSYSQDCIPPT